MIREKTGEDEFLNIESSKRKIREKRYKDKNNL